MRGSGKSFHNDKPLSDNPLSKRKAACARVSHCSWRLPLSPARRLLAPVHAQPQSNNHPVLTNVIPDSESATLQATITGINPTTREVSLRGRSGETVTVTAGPAVRLELLKTDDKVTVQIIRSVAFMVRPPSGGNGTPVNDSQMTQLVAQSAQTPGGIGVRLRKSAGRSSGSMMAAFVSISLTRPVAVSIPSM